HIAWGRGGTWAEGRRLRPKGGAELGAGGEGEGGHQAPLRAAVRLDNEAALPVGDGQRLPVVGVVNSHRGIHGQRGGRVVGEGSWVAGGVGVAVELVRAIRAPEVDDGLSAKVADAGGGAGVGGGIGRVVAQAGHHTVEQRGFSGEEIHQGAVGG